MVDSKEDRLKEIFEKVKGYKPVMDGFVRSRNPYELRYFVVGRHDDRVQQFKQLVIELDAKYNAIEEAQHGLTEKDLEIEELELDLIKKTKDRKQEIQNQKIKLKIKKIQREKRQTHLLMMGAFKECVDFVYIMETEFSDLIDKSEEELLESEQGYWKKRFARQIQVDMISHGRISEGNLKALLQMPRQDQKKILIESNHNLEDYRLLVETANNQFLLESTNSKDNKQEKTEKTNLLKTN